MRCDFEYLSLLVLLVILCGNTTLPGVHWVQLNADAASFDASVDAVRASGKMRRKQGILLVDVAFMVMYTLSYWSRLGNLPALRYAAVVPAVFDTAETAVYVVALRRGLGRHFTAFRILNFFKAMSILYVLGILSAVEALGLSTCSLE